MLTSEQKKIIDKQIESHHHDRYKVDIDLSEKLTLRDFVVFKDVLRPEKMMAHFLARYLFKNQDLYKNRTVLDIGCGTGIQGISTIKGGSKKVILSDITSYACENTKANLEKFDTESVATVVQGDLFESVEGTFDMIIFNHPFFPGAPSSDEPSSIAMLDEGGLLQRFLKEASDYLNEDGLLILPYFNVAGEINDPEIQGEKNGYEVEVLVEEAISSDLQEGMIKIIRLYK